MTIRQYLRALDAQFAGGDATEHSHRPALQALLQEAAPGARVTNEPKQIACGAPDFVLTRGEIRLGYVETKDIGKNLDDKSYREQFDRYTAALENFIITDYLEFRLFRDGAHVLSARIGEIRGVRIELRRAGFAALQELLAAFAGYQGITITSADTLAMCMAKKAQLLAANIRDTLKQDKEAQNTGELRSQLRVFRKHLIHDITTKQFAGIYAQTIAYGMFAARLHDDARGAFSRKKAADLIPAHNPFLRKFFQHIAGYDLDQRIVWIVDELAGMFRAADVGELMKDYGKRTRQTDPFLHFYETFLGAYDSEQRKKRGVYSTPQPVVDFIVRAVDDILRGEFKLREGIAAAHKIGVETEAQNGKFKVRREMHKVQILDPAAGTGTFLAAIIRYIYERYFMRQRGIWPGYVHQNLLPRLHGFEYLMAPYVMAHVKLEMELRATGCELKDRARVFLTNALEEHHPDTGTLMADWLSAEAREANSIKREMPVMVVIGNPPYLAESKNKGEWILSLLQNYKKEPGGVEKLKERNPKWINDDYVKFIRYGHHFIDRTGEGVLAYISNHGFLDNLTFRGMRWSLLQSFDEIYIVDLHGNSKKKETAPDGSADHNVFDIQQGVSINLFVKTGKKDAGALARVFHFDLYGDRESKYRFLDENSLAQVKFAELTPSAPQFFFVPKNYALQADYENGFSVSDVFPVNSSGIVTARNDFTIYQTVKELQSAIAQFRALDDESARAKFSLGADARDWKVHLARIDLENNVFANGNDTPVPIFYRPFDIQYTYYTGNSRGFHCRPRGKIMRHFLAGANVGLLFMRGGIEEKSAPVFLTKHISDCRSWSRPGMQGIETSAPIYLYPETAQKQLDGKPTRKPNLHPATVEKIAAATGLHFTPEKESGNNTFAPIDILDYIYAVLHAPSYREQYNEFLKIDFPRVPYPAAPEKFRKLAKLGGDLRKLHLLEDGAVSPATSFDVAGDDTVTAKITRADYQLTDMKNRTGRVRINPTQYFGNVPESAWNFFIGGYQPAQKYLKDRRARKLSADEILHYQKIIAALTETARLMTEIDRAWRAG